MSFKKIRKCLFPAAGYGTRFVTGRGKRAIEDHFDVNYEMEHEIEGTPAEISLASIRRLIKECTFFLH